MLHFESNTLHVQKSNIYYSCCYVNHYYASAIVWYRHYIAPTSCISLKDTTSTTARTIKAEPHIFSVSLFICYSLHILYMYIRTKK